MVERIKKYSVCWYGKHQWKHLLWQKINKTKKLVLYRGQHIYKDCYNSI